jgi:hypothetical protein
MNKSVCSALLAYLAVLPAAHAEDTLLLTGAEASDAAYYAYLGAIVPGPGRENGRGFFQRYWLDGFGYKYDGVPGRVDAKAWGAEASLGWGTSSPSGWASASAGLRYTDTSLSPDDPTATARGSQLGLKLQFDGEHDLGDSWRLGAIASYTTRQDGYWGRLRLMNRGSAARSLGVEFIANGNDEANSTAAGIVYAIQPPGRRWSISLRAGYRLQDEADGIYGGIEFGRGF